MGDARRREPRWVACFLRALERTGEVRAGARDAGVDHSSVYARKRAYPDFAAAVEAAKQAFKARVKAEEAEAIAAVKEDPSTIRSSADGSPPHGSHGEELSISAGKVRRVGPGRWSAAKEQRFFEELAATANLRMAADAVGISSNAIRVRLLKHPLFAAKFDAVLQSTAATIDLYLVQESRRSFDPESIDTGEVTPKVTIDQAIKISQLNASKRKKAEADPDPFAEPERGADAFDGHSVREDLVRKLRRLRDREMPDWIAKGWSFDEEYDHLVPPGWVRAGSAPGE
jgi:hypothetical protein